MKTIIGIDLGTTFSAIARLDDHGQPAIIPVDGERIMASCVSAPKGESGQMYVGNVARNNLGHEPESVVKRFKREMGSDKVYRLRPGLEITPVAASSAILRKLVQEAAKEYGPITEVVVTVPANFAERQRQATMEAGELAGLNVTNIINEPTAAVIAYASQRPVKGTVLVYDLGGGTFDVTIAKVDGTNVECLTSEGDSELGGMDFDQKIAEIVDARHKDQFGRSLREALGIAGEEGELKSAEWQMLLLEAEKWKKTLSQMHSARVNFNEGPDGRLQFELTRQEFEKAISSLIARTEMRVETAMENLGLKPSDIDEVLLVGGSSRVPAVKDSLRRIFGKEPSEGINLDEAVALGAAIYAGLRANKGQLSPLQREKLSKVSVADVANHFYGTIAMHQDEELGLDEERVTIIIPKNTPLPCTMTETFYTRVPNQRIIRCRVTQSADEEDDPAFVNIVHDWNAGELPSGRPAQQPVEVTYSYDLNQVMHVKIRDVNSGRTYEPEGPITLGGGQRIVATKVPDFRID